MLPCLLVLLPRCLQPQPSSLLYYLSHVVCRSDWGGPHFLRIVNSHSSSPPHALDYLLSSALLFPPFTAASCKRPQHPGPCNSLPSPAHRIHPWRSLRFQAAWIFPLLILPRSLLLHPRLTLLVYSLSRRHSQILLSPHHGPSQRDPLRPSISSLSLDHLTYFRHQNP